MIEHSTGNRKALGSIPSGVEAFLFSQKKLFKSIINSVIFYIVKFAHVWLIRLFLLVTLDYVNRKLMLRRLVLIRIKTEAERWQSFHAIRCLQYQLFLWSSPGGLLRYHRFFYHTLRSHPQLDGLDVLLQKRMFGHTWIHWINIWW